MDFWPLHLSQVYAINGDGPLVDFIELHKQVNNGGLTCPGRPYNGNLLTRSGLGRKVINDGLIRPITEGNLVEGDLPLNVGQGLWQLVVIRHFFFIKEFGDPTHGCPRLLQGGHALGQLGNGLTEDPHIDHKGHDGPHGHATALLQGQDSPNDNN